MDKPVEKCAVVLAYNVEAAADVTRVGLGALQHRGQDASRVVALGLDGSFDTFGGEGLVKDVYDLPAIAAHAGRVAVGHNRYATSGGQGHTIPTEGRETSLAHNGNMLYFDKLKQAMEDRGIDRNGANDTVCAGMFFDWEVSQGATPEEAGRRLYELIADAGSFCIVALTKHGALAMRDRYGFRPLVRGRKGKGHVVASETIALEEMGATDWQEVNPGEMLLFEDGQEPSSIQLEKPDPKGCLTEYVYVASPDSIMNGRYVREIRQDFGRLLAREHPVPKADMVVPVPRTAIPAGEGYAAESGIPLVEVIIAEDDRRSFIEPTKEAQVAAVAKKLSLDPEKLGDIEGKSLIVTDDSIFRGNVQTQVVRMLREGGARGVHVVIASPPVRYSNGLGVATPTQEELIAYNRTVEEVAKLIGADSLTYLSLDGTVRCIGLPAEQLNTSDFTGENVIEALNRELVNA